MTTPDTLPTPTDGDNLRDIARAAPGLDRALPNIDLFVVSDYVPVAFYPATEPDGHNATVYVHRAPAMFYRVMSEQAGVDLSTGSDMHDLVHYIAESIAAGTLGTYGYEPAGGGTDDADRCKNCGHMPAPGSTNCAEGCTHDCEAVGINPLSARAPEVDELLAAIKRHALAAPLDPEARSDMITDLLMQWFDANGYDLSVP